MYVTPLYISVTSSLLEPTFSVAHNSETHVYSYFNSSSERPNFKMYTSTGTNIGITLGWGGARLANAPQIFVIPKNTFLAAGLKGGK
jgi:hypothetical protein